MKTTNLRAYIGKRIRILRIQKNMTQQQLEEYADLPLKYAYKLENLEPNIKIQTLEKIMSALEAKAGTVKAFDALKIAAECGSVKAVNVVLLGAASNDLPFDEDTWIKVIEENVKPKFVELNKKAFEMGRNA